MKEKEKKEIKDDSDNLGEKLKDIGKEEKSELTLDHAINLFGYLITKETLKKIYDVHLEYGEDADKFGEDSDKIMDYLGEDIRTELQNQFGKSMTLDELKNFLADPEFYKGIEPLVKVPEPAGEEIKSEKQAVEGEEGTNGLENEVDTQPQEVSAKKTGFYEKILKPIGRNIKNYKKAYIAIGAIAGALTLYAICSSGKKEYTKIDNKRVVEDTPIITDQPSLFEKIPKYVVKKGNLAWDIVKKHYDLSSIKELEDKIRDVIYLSADIAEQKANTSNDPAEIKKYQEMAARLRISDIAIAGTGEVIYNYDDTIPGDNLEPGDELYLLGATKGTGTLEDIEIATIKTKSTTLNFVYDIMEAKGDTSDSGNWVDTGNDSTVYAGTRDSTFIETKDAYLDLPDISSIITGASDTTTTTVDSKTDSTKSAVVVTKVETKTEKEVTAKKGDNAKEKIIEFYDVTPAEADSMIEGMYKDLPYLFQGTSTCIDDLVFNRDTTFIKVSETPYSKTTGDTIKHIYKFLDNNYTKGDTSIDAKGVLPSIESTVIKDNKPKESGAMLLIPGAIGVFYSLLIQRNRNKGTGKNNLGIAAGAEPTLDEYLKGTDMYQRFERITGNTKNAYEIIGDEIGAVVESYNSGKSVAKIAKEKKVSNSYVTEMLAIAMNAQNMKDRNGYMVKDFEINANQYNSKIAEKSGADNYLVELYMNKDKNGMTNKDIMERFKKDTGMSISQTQLYKVLHQYETQTGKEIVGKPLPTITSLVA